MNDLLADLWRLSGRHAESLAPTLVAGSQLPLEDRGSFRPSVPAASGAARVAPGDARRYGPATSLPVPAEPARRGWFVLGALLVVALVGALSFVFSGGEDGVAPPAASLSGVTPGPTAVERDAVEPDGVALGAAGPTGPSVTGPSAVESAAARGSQNVPLAEPSAPVAGASPKASSVPTAASTAGKTPARSSAKVPAESDDLKRENPFD
jgi:hypothetical protein